jgi:hypothetical protein
MKAPFMAYSMAQPYATDMTMFKRPFRIALIASFVMALPVTAHAQQRLREDQSSVYKGTQNGTLLPLRSIENAILPRMKASGADYIGQEFDSSTKVYRLKFMRGQSVIWVDVDGRTGAIVGRAGG